jgi:2,4'-dihydroxyacetophenone dioxygenase
MSTALPGVLKRTLHIDPENTPWVPSKVGDGVVAPTETEIRVLHYQPEDDVVVSMLRAQPFAESALHRHLDASYGITMKGQWGHDRDYLYRPGVYLYETPGVVHQFLNGPEVSEVYFLYHGIIEFVNPESPDEVIGQLKPADVVRGYYEVCEALNIERPNVL